MNKTAMEKCLQSRQRWTISRVHFEATAQVLLLDYLRRSGSSEMHGAARSLVADLRNPFLSKMPCELRVSSPTRLAYAFDD